MNFHAYIVVEDMTDREMIANVLHPELLENVGFGIGEGKSSALSTARTFLKTRGIPTAIVIDSDSVDSTQIEETKETYDMLLRQASDGTPYKLLINVPEMEVVFFKDKAIFFDIFHRTIDDRDMIKGQYEPKHVICSLFQVAKSTQNIKNWQAMRKLGQYHPFDELAEFLKEMRAMREMRYDTNMDHPKFQVGL